MGLEREAHTDAETVKASGHADPCTTGQPTAVEASVRAHCPRGLDQGDIVTPIGKKAWNRVYGMR